MGERMQHSRSVSALTLAIAIVALAVGRLRAESPSVRTVPPPGCQPVGRILSAGDRHLGRGSVVCKGERITPLAGEKVSFLCFRSGAVQQVQGPVAVSIDDCVPVAVEYRPCRAGDQLRCIRFKGTLGQPYFLRPSPGRVVQDRPGFAWQPVPGATRYLLTLQGVDLRWTISLTTTATSYPAEAASLQPGHAYQASVVALRGDEPLTGDEQVISILSETEARRVKFLVEIIGGLNLPPDQAALDLDRIYSNWGLLDESLSVLRRRVAAGSRDQDILQRLGERLVQVGELEAAEQVYRRAKAAMTSPEDLKAIQAQLEIITQLRSSFPPE